MLTLVSSVDGRRRRQMSSRYRAIVLCLGFLICALLTPHPSFGQPEGAIPRASPRFLATAVKLKAIDESGADWRGSDEVHAWYYDFNYNHVTGMYNGFDTGDTMDLAPRDRCLAPQPRCDHGVSSIHFAVAFWERDKPLWPIAGFCYGYYPETTRFNLSLNQITQWSDGICNGDDLIGRKEVRLSLQQLLAALPTVGASIDYKLRLGGPCGHTEDLCGVSWLVPTGPEYELTYRVTRLPDEGTHIGVAPPSAISLEARFDTLSRLVTLTWAGATTNQVDIHRVSSVDNGVITTTDNDGSYVEALTALGTYRYRVCNRSSTVCSRSAAIVVG